MRLKLLFVILCAVRTGSNPHALSIYELFWGPTRSRARRCSFRRFSRHCHSTASRRLRHRGQCSNVSSNLLKSCSLWAHFRLKLTISDLLLSVSYHCVEYMLHCRPYVVFTRGPAPVPPAPAPDALRDVKEPVDHRGPKQLTMHNEQAYMIHLFREQYMRCDRALVQPGGLIGMDRPLSPTFDPVTFVDRYVALFWFDNIHTSGIVFHVTLIESVSLLQCCRRTGGRHDCCSFTRDGWRGWRTHNSPAAQRVLRCESEPHVQCDEWSRERHRLAIGSAWWPTAPAVGRRRRANNHWINRCRIPRTS